MLKSKCQEVFWTLNSELWTLNSDSDLMTQRLKNAKTQSFSATLWLCDSATQNLSNSKTQKLSVSVTWWLKKILFSFYRKKRNWKAPAAAKHAKIMILALNKKNSLRSNSFLFLTLQPHNFLTLFSQGGSSKTTNSELWTLNFELWTLTLTYRLKVAKTQRLKVSLRLCDFVTLRLKKFLNSSVPQILNSSDPQFLRSSIPQFLTPTLWAKKD